MHDVHTDAPAVAVGGGALAIVPADMGLGSETVGSFFAAKVVAFIGNAATDANEYWLAEGEFRGRR
jgi:hypothetical protein